MKTDEIINVIIERCLTEVKVSDLNTIKKFIKQTDEQTYFDFQSYVERYGMIDIIANQTTSINDVNGCIRLIKKHFNQKFEVEQQIDGKLCIGLNDAKTLFSNLHKRFEKSTDVVSKEVSDIMKQYKDAMQFFQRLEKQGVRK